MEESAAYAWGLVSQGEVLAVVRPQRDAMLLALPLRSLQVLEPLPLSPSISSYFVQLWPLAHLQSLQ